MINYICSAASFGSAALRFAFTAPSREKVAQKRPQTFLSHKL